jgi:phosphopantothenoylcysteine decarboxylase/phosphopantothenate--cysteine ligase
MLQQTNDSWNDCLRALAKIERKFCDPMISNGPQAISATDNEVDVLKPTGEVLATIAGTKENVAAKVLKIIQSRLIESR